MKTEKQPQKTRDEGAWVCNECGSAEFTGSVSKDDIAEEALSCTRCGGREFHWVE